jgi:hypothetical protein
MSLEGQVACRKQPSLAARGVGFRAVTIDAAWPRADADAGGACGTERLS